jgi:nucleotide-binding universal stress UspA family protein
MKARTIIVPTDFSTSGQSALAHATSLARDSNARLLIVHVEEPPIAYGGGEMYYGLPEPDPSALKRMLEEVRPDDASVKFEHRLLAGDPAGAIAELARKEAADLVVMGTHGRTGLARMLMGSVAEAVVRHAPCPVLTCKEPKMAPAKRK